MSLVRTLVVDTAVHLPPTVLATWTKAIELKTPWTARVVALALVESLSIKRRAAYCNCGRHYTEAAYNRLEFVGIQDGEGRTADLEMRNCFCGSTICVELAPPDTERGVELAPPDTERAQEKA